MHESDMTGIITDAEDWTDTGEFEVRSKRHEEGRAGVFMADDEHIYEMGGEEAINLIRSIAKALDLGVFLYNIPHRLTPCQRVS